MGEPPKACLVSFFMDNVHAKTLELQQAVVDKYNVSQVPHLRVKTNASHAQSMDALWKENEKRLKFDIVFFLDIDCIPLSKEAIDLYAAAAAGGKMIGNAQRSNHLQNDQHVFAAPSALAVSANYYEAIGRPSAVPTRRGDVAEEYTFAAEAKGLPVEIVLPLKFDRPPLRMEWETDHSPHWSLADGMPVYGLGTTFGDSRGELFWHAFQIAYPGHQELFWARCETELRK